MKKFTTVLPIAKYMYWIQFVEIPSLFSILVLLGNATLKNWFQSFFLHCCTVVHDSESLRAKQFDPRKTKASVSKQEKIATKPLSHNSNGWGICLPQYQMSYQYNCSQDTRKMTRRYILMSIKFVHNFSHEKKSSQSESIESKQQKLLVECCGFAREKMNYKNCITTVETRNSNFHKGDL